MARLPGPASTPVDGLDDFERLLQADDRAPVEPPRHGREPRRRRRIWPWLLAVLLVLALAVGGAGLWAYQTYPEQVKSLFGWSNDYSGSGTGTVNVEIRAGQSGGDIAQTLVAKGVTKTESAFVGLIAGTKTESSLKPGTFRLKHHMSAKSALAALTNPANLVQSTVAIPEGSTVKQILKLTSTATGTDLADLQALAKDPQSLGVPKSAPNLEGWLFPATYDFPPDTSARVMLQTMVDRMKKALDDAGVPEKNREKVLILAGLVQKEGNGPDDAKVARVFLNRIKVGMRLQSDATVSYGAGGTTVVPTKKQYASVNGYNTYKRDGLPIGPISNPGDAAIAAALHPAKGPWLYFVTVNLKTGKTVFSTTLAQHDKAAAEFARWLKANPDYAK